MILPVSFLHTKTTIKEFVRKRAGTENEVKLPLGIFESTKNLLFESLPTTAYPYEVWIDPDGKFIKASGGEDVTESNLLKALRNENLSFKSKHYQINFDNNKPLLTNSNGGPDTSFTYRSLLTHYLDSVSSNHFSQPSEKNNHILVVNKSIIYLISMSLKQGHTDDIYNQYVVFDVDTATKNKIIGNPKFRKLPNWAENNLFCYDLKLPPSFTREDAYNFMHQDLDRFFKIKSHRENHDMDCLVLKRIDTIDRLRTQSKEVKTLKNDSVLEIQKRTIDDFLSYLNTADAPIMINGSNYSGEVDIHIKLSKRFDVNDLNNQLENYGLRFNSEKRMLPAIIIKE